MLDSKVSLDILEIFYKLGALTWYGKLPWESADAWNLIILCLLIVWSMIFYGAFEFLCNFIANL